MADTNRQENRVARLDTPLETDRLALSQFEGSEGLSELFEFNVEALSRRNDITADELLGETSTVTFHTIDDRQRHFNGHVSDVELIGVRNDNFVYRLVLRPWLWMLSLATDCCIFHEKTAPEIIKDVFDRYGFAKHDFRLTKTYPKLEYTVQYRESDLDFVRRLMEENGISFFFVHSPGEHTLVLSDATTCYETMPGGLRPFVGLVNQHRREGEHFATWVPQRRMTSGAVMFKEYDFKKPSTSMDVNKSDAAKYSNSSIEVYDYPGRYVETGPGGELASSLLNSLRAADGRFRATGDCVTAAPGMLFTLKDHYDPAQNREYLLLKCFHSYSGPDYRSSDSASGEEPYEGTYEMMSSDKPFAPAQITQRPFVQGPQTAVVVNEQNDSTEIDVDKWGRILVHFPWDRRADKSMRCRLSQSWAGKNWGGIYIPRVGMEVIVEFLEGNPDRPLVTGTVYNNNNMPPYSLPDQKYLAGFKSQSTPKGGAAGGGGSGGGTGGGGGAAAGKASNLPTKKERPAGAVTREQKLSVGKTLKDASKAVDKAGEAVSGMVEHAILSQTQKAANATRTITDKVADRMDDAERGLRTASGAMGSLGLPTKAMNKAAGKVAEASAKVREVGGMVADTIEDAGEEAAARAKRVIDKVYKQASDALNTAGTAIGEAERIVEGLIEYFEDDDDERAAHGQKSGGGSGGGGSGGGASPGGGGGGGGTRGYNEYVFDDTEGKELIRQHGQYDLESKVENDERFEIGRDRSVKIGRHLTTEIGKNETRKVGESRKTNVAVNDTLEVGKVLKIKADEMIEIKCGGSVITMTPEKITIKSLSILVEANDLTEKAVETKYHAVANMDIKGGMVKINS